MNAAKLLSNRKRASLWYYANRTKALAKITKRQSTPEFKAEKRIYDLARRQRLGEQCLQRSRDYYALNKDAINVSRRTQEGRKKRSESAMRTFKTNPNSKLATLLRNRVRAALKAKTRQLTALELIGCTLEELRSHLESRFLPGMCWNNHTLKGWHIDHVIPCSAFDLSKKEDQRRCFNYKNLRPLWWIDNLKKGKSMKQLTGGASLLATL